LRLEIGRLSLGKERQHFRLSERFEDVEDDAGVLSTQAISRRTLNCSTGFNAYLRPVPTLYLNASYLKAAMDGATWAASTKNAVDQVSEKESRYSPWIQER